MKSLWLEGENFDVSPDNILGNSKFYRGSPLMRLCNIVKWKLFAHRRVATFERYIKHDYIEFVLCSYGRVRGMLLVSMIQEFSKGGGAIL